jgi:hypothetical protein
MTRSRSRIRRRIRRLALAAGTACLALPAVAAADSIVYIDGGNVWSASADGATKVQLTDGGQWHSPTQSDSGMIAAVQGTGPIQLMTGAGQPIHTITTAAQKSADGGTFAPRPVNLALSPDGSKLAYEYTALSCPPASSCGTTQSSVFYTETNVTTATDVSVYGNQFSVGQPEWVTNSRTLVFGGAGSQVSIDDLGAGDYSHTPWMTPNLDLGDGDVSPDGKRLVTTADYGANLRLGFFEVKGDVRSETPPEFPTFVCESAADPKLADPTWSPDSQSFAWVQQDGLTVQRFGKFVGGDGCAEAPGSYRILSPTGSQPDWGPANPPAARWTPPVVVEPRPQPKPGPSQQQPGAVLKLVSGRTATAKALTKGLKLQVQAPAAGRVSVTLRDGKRKLATGKATAKRAGTVTVKLAKVRRAKALKGRKLTLAVKQAGSAGLSTTLKVR